jgi:hypothetical protein
MQNSASVAERYGITGDDGESYEGNNIIPALCNPMRRVLEQNKPLPELFHELTNRLNKFFSISRSTMIVRDWGKNLLRVAAAWDNSKLSKGLMLTIPHKKSCLYGLIENNSVTNIPLYDKFPGNLIEARILAEKTDSTLTICPLYDEDNIYGLYTLSSPVPYAFELIEEGYLNPVLRLFGSVLSSEKSKTRLINN